MGDQFAIAAPRTMKVFASGYTTTLVDEVRRNPRRALYPEREMWRHFRSARLRAVTLRDFRSTLVRSSGAHVWHEDALAKLRLDFPDLARVAMPPAVPPGACPRPSSSSSSSSSS